MSEAILSHADLHPHSTVGGRNASWLWESVPHLSAVDIAWLYTWGDIRNLHYLLHFRSGTGAWDSCVACEELGVNQETKLHKAYGY